MGVVPVKTLGVLSAISTIGLVQYKPGLLLFSNPSYLGTFLQLFILLSAGWLFWYVILYPYYFSPLRHLPGPPGGSWWNGQWHRISGEATGAPMIDWINSVPNNGIIRYKGMFNGERLFITHPKALSEVMTTRNYDFIKPSHVAGFLGRVLGIGVLLAEGDEHKKQRKNLAPAFAFRHIKDLYPVFWDKSRDAVLAMCKEFEAKGAKDNSSSESQDTATVMEVGEWTSRATLDIIGIAALGQDFGSISNPRTSLITSYRRVFKPSRQAQILGLLNLFLHPLIVRNIPMKRNGEIEAAAAVIRSTCRQQIRAKKEKLEKDELTDIDILSVALKSGGFTEEQLVDQMMTFLAAGHETTATAMVWAIYMLCLHPEVQTRLRKEIRQNLPSIEEQATMTNQAIDHLPYLNAVLNEVLRYFPPVPLTIRESVRDTTIIGEFIPKGTRIMLIPKAVNKSESLWGPDALKFNPDRWLPSPTNPQSASGGAASNYSFMTFLHGPRSCIGQKFAQAEFACLLAAWVGRFEFALRNELEYDERNVLIKGGVTSKPAKGLHVKTKIVPGW